MESQTIARIRQRGRNMSLTGIIIALSVGVLLPVLLSTTVGIVTLVVGKSQSAIVVGVLVISFTTTAIGSAVAVTVLLGRRSRTARLQADLLANVTHDLHTPLAAIRMYAQTLKMGKLQNNPEQIEASLNTIIRETQWLETMIDRVLTWRVATKDRYHPTMQTATVAKAVDEAVARFLRLVEPNEVALEFRNDTQMPVSHDHLGLSSAVLNLLINAYKYTKSEKKIAISTTDHLDNVMIEVKDNGIGIPKHEIHRIFEPFYRTDQRFRSQSTGAGLGLAIVNHLVKTHRGQVEVESTEGLGSRFSIILPKAKSIETPA